MMMRRFLSAALVALTSFLGAGAADASSFSDRLATAASARNAAERELLAQLSDSQGSALVAKATALQKGLAPSLDNPFRTPDLVGARRALDRALEIEGPHWA